jgi:hypothetical protein
VSSVFVDSRCRATSPKNNLALSGFPKALLVNSKFVQDFIAPFVFGEQRGVKKMCGKNHAVTQLSEVLGFSKNLLRSLAAPHPLRIG